MAMCNCFVSLLLLFTVSSVVSETNRTYFDAKTRLVKYLTNNSELMKEILPAQDINTSVDVNVKIYLRQITNVDERYQAIRSTVWLRFNWNNPFLRWSPAEYGGIKSVHANHELFWVPDVALLNEATLEEGTHILYKRLDTKLIIDRHGDCWWNVPATLLSQCKIDVSRFPFDEQECHISIGSWTYSSQKINLTCFEQNADVTNFIESAEWKLKSAVLNNVLRRYNYYGTELPYTDVTLTLKIKRHSWYYIFNIIVPPLTMMFLSLLSFCLPSDNGERITLGMSSLLAFTVYMLIASSFLPETSAGAPCLVIFYLMSFFAMSFCLCATCHSLRNPNITWTEFKAKFSKLCRCCKNQSCIVVKNKDNEEERNAQQDATVSNEPKTDEGGEQEGKETRSNLCSNNQHLQNPGIEVEENATQDATVSNESKTDERGEQEGNETCNFSSLCSNNEKTKNNELQMQDMSSPSPNESSQKNNNLEKGERKQSETRCCCFSCRKLDTRFFFIFLVIYLVLVVVFVIIACL